jgi:uncharacterized protein (DUF1778 family)
MSHRRGDAGPWWEHRIEEVHLRIRATDKALIRHAARAEGTSTSRFLVEAAVQCAEELVARQNRFVVPAGQWTEFTKTLAAGPSVRGL